jgi:hypothetical protein
LSSYTIPKACFLQVNEYFISASGNKKIRQNGGFLLKKTVYWLMTKEELGLYISREVLAQPSIKN